MLINYYNSGILYFFQGLEELVAGKTFTGPVIINSPREQLPVADTNGNRDD